MIYGFSALKLYDTVCAFLRCFFIGFISELRIKLFCVRLCA